MLYHVTALPYGMPFNNALASPTPMIDPIRVCELEAGSPFHHVPRFQRIAPTSRAMTMASPSTEPMFTRRSTGKRWMMLKATAVPPRKTPQTLQTPERTTACHGASDLV